VTHATEAGRAPGLRLLSRAGRWSTAAVLLVALALAPADVAAHEGVSGLEVNVTTANPGALVEVRGDDIGASQTIDLLLAGEAGMAALDRIAVDAEGHFTVIVQLPVDAPEGVYEIRAALDETVLASVPVGIRGEPMAPAGGDHDAPDFAEGVPAIGGPVAGSIPTIPPLIDETPEVAAPASDGSAGWLAVLVVGVAALAAVAFGALVRRRNRAAPSRPG
jgi:hypothetical protein